MFNDVVHCTTRPLRLFAGYESQLTPLGPSNRPPTVGIRRTFAHRRVDQTQWRSSEGQFFEHPSIFIQTIHLKRRKKTKVPFSSPKFLFFCFLSGGQKNVRLGKNQSKKGGKKGTSDVSGFKNLVYSELPWFVPHASRLSSTMMPSMTSKMEPKKKQHVFLFKMDLFQKKIGIWWDLFELVSQIPPKRIRSPRLSVLVLASERLKESLLHLLKLYAGKGWFPAPNQSIVLWSKSRCSGVLALLRTPPTRMVDWLQKLRVAVLPFQVFYNHTVAPVKDPTRLLFDLLVSLRFFVPFAHILVCRPKNNGQPPKKTAGDSAWHRSINGSKRNCRDFE